ncbi:Reducing polyketide synthase DEP5 [Fusarium oxysporum f. sp. albedinis]|nr:Reducing polyketide synthase DEP5 [Fusarium oxysporum f. sp. albedinis]
MSATKSRKKTSINCPGGSASKGKRIAPPEKDVVFSNTSSVGDQDARRFSSLNTGTCLPNMASSDTQLHGLYDQNNSSHDVNCPELSRLEDQSLLATNINRPVRSQSSGSIMSYLWKSQWLKRLSHTATSNNSQLTEPPPRIKLIRSDDRRPSEPVLPSSMALRRMSAWSALSGKPDPGVDGILFKRVFSDLERLLDETLSLALEVADHSETAAHASHPAVSNEYGTDHVDVSNLSMGNRPQENVKAFPIDGVYTAYLARPGCRRAATYTAVPKRPRLADIVESYSGTYQELRTKTQAERRQQSGPSRRSSLSRKSRKSNQGLKADRRRRPVMLKDLRSTSALLDVGGMDAQGQTTTHKRSAAVNVSAAVRSGTSHDALPEHNIAGRRLHGEHGINLRKRSHVSLRDIQGFNLPKSHIRQPIARDYTALIGVLLGIYTGLVPSIQYYVVDQSHVTVHGNTGCFLALAIPSFFLWPLPLLHGRKPYIMSSLIIAMPLLFPQAIAVSSPRLTNTASWRAILLASRTLMGGSLGFATMNFHSVLTDLFGASLMCQHPHEEVVDHFDARRHGGGMGIWLGIWTWCWIGSLGLGFLIGAAIIDKHSPAWGFYTSIVMIAVVLILNVICPEVRRSAFRRSIAEVRTGGDISRRLARGEVMMHRVKTGPKWWGQEAYHGVRLSLEMLEQPGFAVVAIYAAWIYAQVVLVIILLGSLVSRFYHLRSPYVGLHVAAVALGALLAIPFQKASIFSRSRSRENKVNREVIGRKIVWSSHLVRRAVFTIALPIGGACYAAVSSGPPISSGVPTFFVLCIGFLSCLAISECNGLIMETFDTSDLSPGMVGRHRDPSGQDQRRTNYSSFPRVTAGFAMIQSFSYILAAGSTALGGHVTRKLGQQVATSVVAAILFLLTVLLLLVLIRFKNVLIIPRSKSEEMERITQARRRSSKRRASMPNDLRALMEEDYAWRPTMIGNPMGKSRRMNVLEMGNLTRWQDIRRRNKLIDAGVHLNRDTLDQGLDALDVALENHIDNMRQNASGFFRRGSLRKHGGRLHRSNQSSEQTFHDLELDMLDPVGTPSESSQQPRQYVERECVMGQTIKEENKDEAQAGPSTSQKDHT